MKGHLVAVVGPSGAGKDTLLAGALAARPDLVLARRVITRPAEAGGEDFQGVSAAEFEQMRAARAFVLDWQAHGLSYGIPASILPDLAAGRTVLFNGSRAALVLAQQLFAGLIVVQVWAPPSALAARLAARGRESPTEVAQRLDRAGFEMPAGIKARLVRNDGTPSEGVARLLDALA
ncbi:MAG: phosphonate metabolism protein/1,5-bisphosphokinase (PRPP-forming) PhnN [Alphaproteobacteria bacterium HGW-Alphaproteobacteria-8]|nr:MAG: phosphonate metabolism protein/1,5-bisphosphokinase (PRPP-forming) PhnN [Alphaproteobacteria bacterium HGW-Alphaproteobacteria-8]